MEYKVFNAEGRHVAGDAVLDEVVKAAAMLVDGWVEDDEGTIVYTSPGRRAALEAEAQRKRDEEEQAAADAGAPAEEERDDEPESLTGVVTSTEEE